MRRFLLLFPVVGFLYQCQPSPATDQPANTANKLKDSLLFMVTNMPSVRVRQTPDLQATVVEIINQMGTVLEFQNDSTNFETEVKISNQTSKARWYKVKNVASKKEGWVLGAVAGFVPPAENELLNQQARIQATSSVANAAQPARVRDTKLNEPLISQYQNYLKQLNPKNYYQIGQAAQQYEQLFANTNAATCDVGLLSFNVFYQQATAQVLNKQTPSQYQHLAQEIKSYGRAYVGADSLLYRLSENGIRLSVSDGRVQFAQDMDFVARRFYRFVSPTMREYINQIQIEEETYWEENDRILVDLNKIADWLLVWQYFAERNPNFINAADVRTRGKEWLKLLVYGLPNSPVFNQQKQLNADYRQVYEYILERDASVNSSFGLRFSKFYRGLEANKFSFDNSILRLQQELLGEID